MNPQYPTSPSVSGGTDIAGSSTDQSGKLTQAKQAVSQSARDAASKVKTAASDAASRVRSEAERMASEKKEYAASRVGGYSNALHESARSFEEQDPNIAYFTHQAADRLQGVADYIRSRDFGGLRDDCAGVARRHPAAFFGGLFFAGLLVGNLLKATARPRNQFSYDDEDWRSQSNGFADSGPTEELPMSSSPIAPTPAIN
jgi:hypothetical protein